MYLSLVSANCAWGFYSSALTFGVEDIHHSGYSLPSGPPGQPAVRLCLYLRESPIKLVLDTFGRQILNLYFTSSHPSVSCPKDPRQTLQYPHDV
jgi:hypothetical protein